MTGPRIGITVSAAITDPMAALWSSGINQNIVYLAMLLARLPNVAEVVLLTAPDDVPDHPLAAMAGVPAHGLAEGLDALDIVIEAGVRGAPDMLQRFRDRGGRLVSYMAGNTMAMNFEDIASKVDHGEAMSPVGFDAVWITPQHWRMNHGYAASTRGGTVAVVPHIWHPLALLQSIGASRASEFFWRSRGDAPWRIGVFDPSINVLKTFHIPMLVAENAYRARPDLIGNTLLFGAHRLMGTPHFEEFCAATDLARNGRLFAEQRYPLAQVLGRHVDMVVTHQWENELNYLYWDSLYSGRPLVHNSPALADVGYFYTSFDCADGGRAVIDACERHAREAPGKRGAVLECLWRYHIDNPTVQRAHQHLIDELMDVSR